MLPEFICQNCGRHFFGWGIILVCQLCGGKLELAEEKEEIIRKEERKL